MQATRHRTAALVWAVSRFNARKLDLPDQCIAGGTPSPRETPLGREHLVGPSRRTPWRSRTGEFEGVGPSTR